MEFDDALLLIEEQIESPERFNLDTLAKAFPVVAAQPDGYSGKVWEYSAKVLQLAQQRGISPGEAFDKIGWDTLRSALFSGLSQKNIVQALSFAQHNLIYPARDVRTILKDSRIKSAIENGITAQKRPFIRPSDFGVLNSSGQDAFAELLAVIDDLEVDDELKLQWSASALRFCLPNSRCYLVASEVLLGTLIRDQRYYSAYYLFRALSEDCDNLWSSETSLKLIKVLIQDHINKNRGLEILIDLCLDVDIQRRWKTNRTLRLLIGILSIHLLSEYGFADVETVAWEFPLMIQTDYPHLSSTLAIYITNRDLPELPPQYADQLDELEAELCNLISETEHELRERTYRGVQLAVRIHRDNLKDFFFPVLEKIKHRQSANRILDQIKKIDPEGVISENAHQRKGSFHVEGKLLQQMIKDNRDMKKSLESAAQVLKQIQEIQHERSLVTVEQFEFYQEFELFCEELSEAGQWAFEELIPELWKRMNKGLSVYKYEGGHYGTR
jgi:hypothetical protein